MSSQTTNALNTYHNRTKSQHSSSQPTSSTKKAPMGSFETNMAKVRSEFNERVNAYLSSEIMDCDQRQA